MRLKDGMFLPVSEIFRSDKISSLWRPSENEHKVFSDGIQALIFTTLASMTPRC
ncbi:hypothetical protein MKW98_001069 [Papaver atlanticum]|uniref:Uncharacterized protein n=1 Tax=Papaver atlanticum TaxID=357466 RepID=A0AAD4XK58_9MAGN|nr:hypothetical protein MKW98_001069 [Papaver atlanticum]